MRSVHALHARAGQVDDRVAVDYEADADVGTVINPHSFIDGDCPLAAWKTQSTRMTLGRGRHDSDRTGARLGGHGCLVARGGEGPEGRLPLTGAMLRHEPSGNIFGLTQNAGMGWRPDALGGAHA